MFSYEYQGNLSQARTANKAQFQHSQAGGGRLGPYTKLQSNSAVVREPPVNAKEHIQYEDNEEDVDYSFSHLPVRERRKLFLGENNNRAATINQFQRGRQPAPKGRRANDTQSDYGGGDRYAVSPTPTNNMWSGAPSTGGWASHGGTLPRGGKSSSPFRYMNGNGTADHHVRSQSMHTATRLIPKSTSRTLDYAAQRLDNLEHNTYQASWNSHQHHHHHNRPSDMMTQSAYYSNQNTPVFHRTVTGPATRVIPMKNWQHDSQPLKINVYNSDTYATSAHHSPAGSTIWHHPRAQQRTSYYHQTHEPSHRNYSYSYPRYCEAMPPPLARANPFSSPPLPVQTIQIPIVPNSYSFHNSAPVPCSSSYFQPPAYHSSARPGHSVVYPSSSYYYHNNYRSHTSPRMYISPNSSAYNYQSAQQQPHYQHTMRHTPAPPQQTQIRYPGQRQHTPGYGTVSIPVKPTATSRLVNLRPPSRLHVDSQRNTPGPPSPSPVRPGGRAFFDEEAGVSEF